jgi:hypothetical protein
MILCSRLLSLCCTLFWGAPWVFAQNDKQIIGDAVFTPQEIAEGAAATFLVRFQNVWNDTVYQMVVRDTLDPRFDVESFTMVAASHPYNLLLDGSNVIRWYFTEILLPDSASNFAGSIGFILYNVKPKPFITPGQSIANQACFTMENYPEYCTNQAYLWIDEDADVENPEKKFDFQVVPNPNYGQFEIRQSQEAGHDQPKLIWWITDIHGKIISDGRATDSAAAGNQVWLEKPAPGLYLLWLKENQKLSVEQFAIIR